MSKYLEIILNQIEQLESNSPEENEIWAYFQMIKLMRDPLYSEKERAIREALILLLNLLYESQFKEYSKNDAFNLTDKYMKKKVKEILVSEFLQTSPDPAHQQ